jgi:stalled ribosome alternative rescue factor ArfA
LTKKDKANETAIAEVVQKPKKLTKKQAAALAVKEEQSISMAVTTIGLNSQIREQAVASVSWRHNLRAQYAYQLFDVMNDKLFENKLPQLLIGFIDVELGHIKQDGLYYFMGDGLSLTGHIDLRDDLTPLGTAVALLHNMVHAEQETFKPTKSWYHKQGFRDRMKGFGVLTAPDGSTKEVTEVFGQLITGTLALPEAALANEPLELAGHTTETEETETVITDVSFQTQAKKKKGLTSYSCKGDHEGSKVYASNTNVRVLCAVCGNAMLTEDKEVNKNIVSMTGDYSLKVTS